MGLGPEFWIWKGALLTQSAGLTESGRLWKILEKIVLQLNEWPGNWLKNILLSPSVCLRTSWFFLTQFFWPNPKWWVFSSKWVSQSLFLTWLHSSWIVCVFGQHGCGVKQIGRPWYVFKSRKNKASNLEMY